MATRFEVWRAGVCAALVLAAASVPQPASAQATLPAVAPSYFGLTFHHPGPPMDWPQVSFGSWRLWDARVTWPYLQPARDQWNFKTLDRFVGDAQRRGVKVLLVLAHSPQWASARPTEASAYGLGVASEPAQLADWVAYVRTVAARYKGRIEAYQVWNEPSDRQHYSGTLQQLVELTCEARRAIRQEDPAALVVAAGTAGGGHHIDYQEQFLAQGGKDCIDVMAHHFYVPRHGAEAMVPQIRQVRAAMQRQGVGSMPLWNTETGWWIAATDGTPEPPQVSKGGWRQLSAELEAGATLQRAFLLARAEGVDRFYWYAWANPYGWSLVDRAGQPKPPVAAWEALAGHVLGKVVKTCQVNGDQARCVLVDTAGRETVATWGIGDALTPREGRAAAPFGSEGMPRFLPATPASAAPAGVKAAVPAARR